MYEPILKLYAYVFERGIKRDLKFSEACPGIQELRSSRLASCRDRQGPPGVRRICQKNFAFEWESPKSGSKTQLTSSRLLQGLKNSPTLFGEQLAKDLESWEAPQEEGRLLQYVDDLLVATWTREACVAWTRSPVVKGSYTGLSPANECPHVSSSFGTFRSSFLSGNQREAVCHDCLETIEATYSSHPDLKDTPLDVAVTWFTDRSSYVANGKRHAGYALTTCREVIESGPLPTGTSAQKAEICALTHALEMAKGKTINIYTDSRYAFGVVHAHRAIWKERGLLTSQGKNIKHAQEIIQLLEAVQLPEKVAVMHIKAHQRVSSELEQGNKLADREAKEAAKGEVTTEGALIPDGQISLEVSYREDFGTTVGVTFPGASHHLHRNQDQGAECLDPSLSSEEGPRSPLESDIRRQ
ncbi:uncharacterized protein [Agelaius tricolor]|uniref:uncharacterized protein n=1 Tax=Agelaius tricolor TaxID=9191 RepID=UPI0039F18917